MHVDAASGGFVAPFIQPELEWDFRLPRVQSINASGHKYGLVYPGVGWAVWRDAAALPDELVFRVNYLGGDMPTFALNFSRPGGEVIAQYYMLPAARAGGIPRTCSRAARTWRGTFGRDRRDRPVRADHRRQRPAGVRVQAPRRGHQLHGVRRLARLREQGWLVPAYTFPANLQDVAVLRVVVRNGFSDDMADILLGASRARDRRGPVEAAHAAADLAARRVPSLSPRLTDRGPGARMPGSATGRTAVDGGDDGDAVRAPPDRARRARPRASPSTGPTATTRSASS